MSTSVFSVSIASNDFRYYVKNPADVVDSVIQPLGSDSRYNVLPEWAVLWDSTAKYWSNFENASIAAVYPAMFRSDPRNGMYQNLYALENSFPVPWDSTVYDSSTSLTFPKGFLKPESPVVDFSVDPYEPPLDLEIPDIDPPEPLMPAIVLPDVEGGGNVGNIVIDTDMCINTSVSYSSDSKTATIHINWGTPPPTNGVYAFMAMGGSCYWQRVKICGPGETDSSSSAS